VNIKIAFPSITSQTKESIFNIDILTSPANVTITVNAIHPDLRTEEHLESLARAVDPAVPLLVGGPSSLSYSTQRRKNIKKNS